MPNVWLTPTPSNGSINIPILPMSPSAVHDQLKCTLGALQNPNRLFCWKRHHMQSWQSLQTTISGTEISYPQRSDKPIFYALNTHWYQFRTRRALIPEPLLAWCTNSPPWSRFHSFYTHLFKSNRQLRTVILNNNWTLQDYKGPFNFNTTGDLSL